MANKRDLLIEIGTEELPPKALLTLSEAFSSGICSGLEQNQLNYLSATPFATPRRLAVHVKGVEEVQADREVERRGPALKAAYDKDGNPTKALQGFARSCGVEPDALETVETDKGQWLVFRSTQKGQQTEALIPDMINAALNALPIPKRMRWGDLDSEFVRPVHWLTILFGEQVVETEILSVKSGNATRGHRFHHPEPIIIKHPNEYVKTLEEQGKVFVVFSVRKDRVKNMVQASAEEVDGQAVIDPDLLNEVTSLVEYPMPIMGSFDKKFLDVPQEALISAMQGHQKYFPVVDDEGKLMPYFITVSNIDSSQPEVIKKGNERVIRPRFADAMFFWEQDKAHSLESRLESLKSVTFQHKLGSLYDKSKRVAKLAGEIAKQLGAEELQGIRAAQLSKCDLMSEMVGEFPELQGIMGEYYANHDGETKQVAVALREQYMPRFAGDLLPETILGQAVGIADRLDTLVGIFGIGQPPTGDKDPFGLRRAALSILRVCVESELPLNLKALLQQAQAGFTDNMIDAKAHQQVFDFMLERLRGYAQDRGARYDSVDAVLSCRPDSPYDASLRMHSVEGFRALDAAASLASANKRIHNILKKSDDKLPETTDPTYFEHAAERALYDKLAEVQEVIAPLLKAGDYTQALENMAGLRESVDRFFDEVMVMAEDATVRANRLAFLQSVRHLFLQIADISKLNVG
ncbi:glycine--tRNA ligase subunit beta [Candidatus Albibeggiatoa sp. nov. BB20]|uniref:glycine--tRNA ligase subunit beta n=1 Tax=Candidatus Albibeggiatoa sp. nov. BB20 TaxID=3162723 RepID=UPI0033653586